MEPLAAFLSCFQSSMAHQFLTDALPLKVWMHGGVQQESMHPTIPGHIDKTHQLLCGKSTHINQTVLQNGLKIPVLVPFPGSIKQDIQRFIADLRRKQIKNVFHPEMINLPDLSGR